MQAKTGDGMRDASRWVAGLARVGAALRAALRLTSTRSRPVIGGRARRLAGFAVARSLALVLAGAATVAVAASLEGSGEIEPGEELVEEQVGHSVRPGVEEPTAERIAALRLPEGFRVSLFADELGTPRMLRVGDDGTVYVTLPDEGRVVALRDADGDGRAEEPRTVVDDLDDVHDLVVTEDAFYLVTVKSVYRSDRRPDGTAAAPKKILDGLPDGGRHPNRTIALGPDGALYVSIGSTCNCCVEEHPEAAAVIRFAKDGSGRELFATGLRNTIGFDWHPATNALWGMDHNTDWLGDDFPPEELNLLERGKHYGWPFVHADGVMPETIRYPEGFDRAAERRRSTPPVLTALAHAAPIQMVFYDGAQFPEPYRGDAFVAMHGSWNRKPPGGYEVARIDFAGGRPRAFEPFLSGFLDAEAKETFGRPTGIAVAGDGSLLVGDDETGVVYRISFEGERRASSRPAPAGESGAPRESVGSCEPARAAPPPDGPAAGACEPARVPDRSTPSEGGR